MSAAVAGLAKQLVGVVNAAVMIAGLVGTVLSLALIFATDTVAGIALPFIKDYLAIGGKNNDSTYSEIPSTLKQFGYIILAIAAPLLVVGLVGCCGICFKKKMFLYLYTVLSILLCAGITTALVLWQLNTFDEKLFDKLGSDLRNNYAGVESFNKESLLLNIIQVKMKCCGLENYTDFQEAKKWDRTYNYTDPGGNTHTVQQTIPASCCKFNGEFTNGNLSDTNCTIAPTSQNSYIGISCRQAVSDALNSKELIVIIVLAAVAALEAISALVSIYLIASMNKKEKMEKAQQLENQKNQTDPSQNPQQGIDSKNSYSQPEIQNPYSSQDQNSYYPGSQNPYFPENQNPYSAYSNQVYNPNNWSPYAGSNPYMTPYSYSPYDAMGPYGGSGLYGGSGAGPGRPFSSRPRNQNLQRNLRPRRPFLGRPMQAAVRRYPVRRYNPMGWPNNRRSNPYGMLSNFGQRL